MDKESLKIQAVDCLVMMCEDSEVQVTHLAFASDSCGMRRSLKRERMAGIMAHGGNMHCKTCRSPSAIQLQRGAPGKLLSPESRSPFQTCFRVSGGLRNEALAVCGLAHLPSSLRSRGNREPFGRYRPHGHDHRASGCGRKD